jgi:DNA processing protein
VAVVGSRNASRQGVLNAERMAQTLSEAGVTIVSGLALGIDAAAHLGGLAARQHVAVLGTGIDRIIRPATGAGAASPKKAVSSASARWARRRARPRRNRIISGLARGVLVVEAAASPAR